MTNPRVRCPRCGEVMKTYADLGRAFGSYLINGGWTFLFNKGYFQHRHGNEDVICDYDWHDTPGATQIFAGTRPQVNE